MILWRPSPDREAGGRDMARFLGVALFSYFSRCVFALKLVGQYR